MQDILLTIGGRHIFLFDLIGLLWFIGCWFGYNIYADNFARRNRPNIMESMDKYRHHWMVQMLKRENRMMDATIIGNLMRSISFFASTSIFIIAGLISLLGYKERAMEFIETMPFSTDTSIHSWGLKILLLVIIFVYAFFKYSWSLRQYNYTAIMVAGAPPANESQEEHESYARRASQLNGNAARHFNMALRAYYFGLGALSWFIHPFVFMIASALVVYVLYRREFRSRALQMILD